MAELLDFYATDQLFGFFLIFARISAAMMYAPGFAENYVTRRTRLALSLLVALVVTPVLLPSMPGLPGSIPQMLLLLGGEIFIGLFLGLLTRLIYIALEIGGMMIAFQIGLGNATIFNPAMATQGSLISVFLTLSGVLVIFATNMHHMMLMAFVDSYSLFEPGTAIPFGDFADYFARIFSRSFFLAMQIAAPLLMIGLIFYLGLGLMGRLMPQVQIFFVAIPLQILLGFFVISLTVSTMMFWFIQNFEAVLEGFLDISPF